MVAAGKFLLPTGSQVFPTSPQADLGRGNPPVTAAPHIAQLEQGRGNFGALPDPKAAKDSRNSGSSGWGRGCQQQMWGGLLPDLWALKMSLATACMSWSAHHGGGVGGEQERRLEVGV